MIDWFHQKFIATEKDEDLSQGKVREASDENEMVPAETASDVSKLQVNEIIQQIRSSRQKEKFERLFDGDTMAIHHPVKLTLAVLHSIILDEQETWINRFDFPSIGTLQAEMG